MTAILAPSLATPFQASLWAAQHGATPQFQKLSRLYWDISPARGGVCPEVGYAQAAHETGFGQFGGSDPIFSANASMCNPCGLKTHDGSATAVFPNWTTGVTAHLDHLALYAGATGYPVLGTPDPRAFSSIFGVAPTVESLGGHWAPDPNYGIAVVTLMTEIYASLTFEAIANVCMLLDE
jgi:hypothetical protein